jgi:uncharacterized protein with ATP-grasp and redox domains
MSLVHAPPALRGSDFESLIPAVRKWGEFTRHSVAVRLPAIVGATLEQNPDLRPTDVARLRALAVSIQANEPIEPGHGLRWLAAPWFAAEHIFYQKLCNGLTADPFAAAKAASLESARPIVSSPQWAAIAERALEPLDSARLCALIRLSLWGNKADLSLSAGRAITHSTTAAREAASADGIARIIVDDSERLASFILRSRDERPPAALDVGILLDNCGLELLSDLLLVDALLSGEQIARDPSMAGVIFAPVMTPAGVIFGDGRGNDGFYGVRKVVLFCKKTPIFVSDAMEHDVQIHIAWLKENSAGWGALVAARLEKHIAAGRIELRSPSFLVSPYTYDAAGRAGAGAGADAEGESVKASRDAFLGELAELSLVLAKGDANYRRLLGDRHWPSATPLHDIIEPWWPLRRETASNIFHETHVTLVALRTTKSAIICGVDDATVAALDARDPRWLVNGEWGLIHGIFPEDAATRQMARVLAAPSMAAAAALLRRGAVARGNGAAFEDELREMMGGDSDW